MCAYIRWTQAVVVAFASIGVSAASTDCALFGPDFPAPREAATDPSLAEAFATLENEFESSFNLSNQAYSVAVFSVHDDGPLWEYHHTPSIPFGVGTVDGDAIYRVGSISKIFTVWTMLISLGDVYLDHSVTEFVPELQPFLSSPVPEQGMEYDDIDNIRWEDITLRDLASHAAGIPRDLGQTELSQQDGPLGGLPELPDSDLIDCDSADSSRQCTAEGEPVEIIFFALTWTDARVDFFKFVTQQSPSFPSAHSPAYSNNAFFLLGEAFKNITGKTIEVAMGESILEPLGLAHTTFGIPTITDFGVIPGDDQETSGWSNDLGIRSPGGSLFSSTNDLVQAGRAILSSSLLPPAQTRRWFDYATQTSYPGAQVGTPWEPMNLQDNSTGRLVTLHTKGGDTDMYHAKLVLSRAHDMGYVVLTAGTAAVAGQEDTRGPLANALGDALIPAMEAAARREAVSNYAGTYADEATNSSVVISVDEGRMGLTLGGRTTNGIASFEALELLMGMDLSEPRLYPTTLTSVCTKSGSCGERYVCRTGWRAVFMPQTQTGVVMDPCLGSWGLVGASTYGGRGLDEWVFELGEDGKATGVEFRAARMTLKKVM